jgi:hypothetical protein
MTVSGGLLRKSWGRISKTLNLRVTLYHGYQLCRFYKKCFLRMHIKHGYFLMPFFSSVEYKCIGEGFGNLAGLTLERVSISVYECC